MLFDKIAKVAGMGVRGVTLTVGTVGGTIYNEIKSVPNAFIDGLTAGQGLPSKKQAETVVKTSEKTGVEKNAENNNSIFKY